MSEAATLTTQAPTPAPQTGSQAISQALNSNVSAPVVTPETQPVSAPNPSSPQSPAGSTQAPAPQSPPASVQGELSAPTAPSLATSPAPQGYQQPQFSPEQVQQAQDTLVLQGVYQASLQRGATPELAQQAVQLAAGKLQTDRERSALENHPIVRTLAAQKAVEPYAAYGVKAEDVFNAPSPEAMVYSAYTLAQKNYADRTQSKVTALQARVQNGSDSFEGATNTGSGQVTNYYKTPGKDLIRNALRASH